MKRQQGFTLIEASVAIAVLAILSGAIAPVVIKNLTDAKIARAKNDVSAIAGVISNQLKDTGVRPVAAAGATAVWVSGLNAAGNAGAPIPASDTGALAGATAGTTAAAAGTNTTFLSLFNNTVAQGNGFFGTPNGDYRYQLGYMSADVAGKTDPWGNAYMIFGYNSTGQASNSGIFVVSAGPDGLLGSANVTSATTATSAWKTTDSTTANLKNSYDDIVTRIN